MKKFKVNRSKREIFFLSIRVPDVSEQMLASLKRTHMHTHTHNERVCGQRRALGGRPAGKSSLGALSDLRGNHFYQQDFSGMGPRFFGLFSVLISDLPLRFCAFTFQRKMAR